MQTGKSGFWISFVIYYFQSTYLVTAYREAKEWFITDISEAETRESHSCIEKFSEREKQLILILAEKIWDSRGGYRAFHVEGVVNPYELPKTFMHIFDEWFNEKDENRKIFLKDMLNIMPVIIFSQRDFTITFQKTDPR